MHPLTSLLEDETEHALTLIDVTLQDGRSQRYFLPVSVRWRGDQLRRGAATLPRAVAKVRRGSRVLTDSAHDEGFAHALIAAMKSGRGSDTCDTIAH